MSTKRYPEEFKIEVLKQVTERGHTVADVASRLGVSTHSLYKWCWRRFKIEPPCRLNFEPGLMANL